MTEVLEFESGNAKFGMLSHQLFRLRGRERRRGRLEPPRNPQPATRIIYYFTNLKEKKEKKPKVLPD